MVCGPTMNLRECTEAFRANQISISESTLAHGIMQGKFDFAIGIEAENARVFRIFRDKFYTWLDEMLMREAIRINPM